MRLVLHHADGTTHEVSLRHSFTADQIGWFRAGLGAEPHPRRRALIVARAVAAILVLAAVAGGASRPRPPRRSFPASRRSRPTAPPWSSAARATSGPSPPTGGVATRLTAHPAYDREPVFSPDGASLCFASDREGATDLYVMPVDGGVPRRLTYAPVEDLPQDWSSDGTTPSSSPRAGPGGTR